MCVWVCVFFLQKVSLPEFNVVERMKETRQMAYPHHLMTWSSELRHELDTANIITSFLKNLVVGTTNLWNCEVIITFTDLLPCRPFCLNLFPAYFLDLQAQEYAFHSFCVGGISFNLQAGMVRHYWDSRWLTFGFDSVCSFDNNNNNNNNNNNDDNQLYLTRVTPGSTLYSPSSYGSHYPT